MPDAAGILPIGLAKVLNSANPAVGQSDDVGRKCVSDLPAQHNTGPTSVVFAVRKNGGLSPISKLESNVRYLGFEVDDALEISEQTEI